MNVPLLLLAAAVLLGVWGWILSDVRVRTLRSVLLLVASTTLTLTIWNLLPSVWGFGLGAAVGAGSVLPVLLRHRLILSLRPPDADMVRAFGQIDRQLVGIGKQLRRREVSPAEYEKRLTELHDTSRSIRPADEEWAKVARDFESEIASTLSMVRQRSGPPEQLAAMHARRSMVRGEFRELVHRRARFFA